MGNLDRNNQQFIMKVTPTSLVLFSICLVSVVGWWEIGHMATAQVAVNRLKELGHQDALDKFTKLVQGFANLTDGRSNTFVTASVWADDLKEFNVSYFNDYHFTDVVYDPQNMFISMTQFQKDVNSINTYKSAESVLKTNKEGITFERCFMARFLLHLAGDIHQPLHSVTMYNSTLKTGDLGGNKIYIITKADKNMNLHAFMDSMAGEQEDGVRPQRPLTDVGKAYLQNLAGSITKQFPPEHFTDSQIADLDAHSWTIESYNSAVEKVYPYVLTNKFLNDEYTKLMFDLCRQRVALGGYRLANSIINIYK